MQKCVGVVSVVELERGMCRLREGRSLWRELWHPISRTRIQAAGRVPSCLSRWFCRNAHHIFQWCKKKKNYRRALYCLVTGM